MNLWLPGGKCGGRDRPGVRDGHVHTAIYEADNQQEPTVQHRELCSMLCNNQMGQELEKE